MIDRRNRNVGLIMMGFGGRALIAAVVSAAVWAMFFWATSSPGGL